jgi:ligand-binding sensor domain-containing protein
MLTQCLSLLLSHAKQSLLFVLLLSFVLAVLLPQMVLAQSADSPWVPYKQEDGLASNNVVKILPADGEIWFGTDNGVSRFNGEWTSWKAEDGFVPGIVRALVKDSINDVIYGGTSDGYVVRWNGATWANVVRLSGAIQVLQLVDGHLWIGTSKGLFIWKGSEAVPVEELRDISIQSLASHANSVWVGTNQGLWLFQRQSWAQITTEDGLPGNDVTAIWIDPNGPIYVGTTQGLTQRDPITGTWTEIPLENQQGNPFQIRALTGNESGEVWGGADGDGAFLIVGGQFIVPFSGDIGLTTRYVQAVAIDQDNSIWFGTAAGVFRYDPKAWVKELREYVLFPGINYINTLLVDEQNRVWIGTAGGGIRLKENGARPSTEEITFVPLQNKPAGEDQEGFDAREPVTEYVLPDGYVNTLVQDSKMSIWAGTQRGVVRYSPQNEEWSLPLSVDELPSEIVNVLLADQDTLWIGTDAGLARYNVVTAEFSIVDTLEQYNIQALAVDSRRRLWVGTLSDGLFIQENERWTHVQYEPGQTEGISGNAVVALAADASGGMWIGVDRHGLNYWDGQQWLDYANRVELPSNLLYTLYTDPIDGSLWIGSEGGVTRYDGRTWETLNVESILPSASIFAIVRTLDSSYWFGSKDGLTFYHPERTPPWIRIDTISGSYRSLPNDTIEVQTDQRIGIRFIAGDLHTAASSLEILYRVSGPGHIGEWLPATGEFLQLPEFAQAGDYLVELMARDLAFNYSEPARLGLQVVPPPATVQLPIVGAVPIESLIAFSIIGGVAAISLIYMSISILQARRRTREALIRGFNPFVSGEPVRREDMFFGRQDLLQRIIDTLHNNSIMIHGERRIGKTTLLYQLAARLREVNDAEYWFIPLYIDLEGTTEDSFFHFLMEEVLQGVMTLPGARERLQPELENLLYHKTPTAEYTDRQFSRDLREVIGALQAYGEESYPNKHMRLILLLDEMDVMSNYSRVVQQRLRRIFMRDFAASLGAVVAGIQISKEWDRVESPWYNLFNEIELGPFNRQQAIQLLTEPVQEYYRYDPAALEFIIEQSDGRPFRLQQYALEAINRMLASGRRVITLGDVEYAHEHIQYMGNDVDAGLDDPQADPEMMAASTEVESSLPVSSGESPSG